MNHTFSTAIGWYCYPPLCRCFFMYAESSSCGTEVHRSLGNGYTYDNTVTYVNLLGHSSFSYIMRNFHIPETI